MENVDQFIFEFDAKAIAGGLPLPTRSTRALLEYCIRNSIPASLFSGPEWEAIATSYELLRPARPDRQYKFGAGICVAMGEACTVQAPLIHGERRVSLLEYVDLLESEIISIERHYPSTLGNIAHAAAEVLFLTNRPLKAGTVGARNMAAEARFHIHTLAATATGEQPIPACFQSIHLAVELALKAALSYSGLPGKDVRAFQHRIHDALEATEERTPLKFHADLKSILRSWPKFVEARYHGHNLKPWQIAHGALLAQHIVYRCHCYFHGEYDFKRGFKELPPRTDLGRGAQ